MFIIESNLSNPLTFPSFKTKIFSQSFIVFKRWAIVMTVDSFSLSRTTFQTVCSVSGSTCAVGSSKTTILLRCSSTRAKQINCRSPTLTLAPCSSSSWSSLASSLPTKSFSCTSSKACHKSVSWYLSKMSRFYFNDPLKRRGLWPRTEIPRRACWRPISLTGTSSMIISPSASGMRIRAATKDDFPAPVRPATPIFAPPLMLRLMFFSTWGPPG